jgi:hypothetical protein
MLLINKRYVGRNPNLAGDGITIQTMQDMEISQLEALISNEKGTQGQEGTNSKTEEVAEKTEPADAQAKEADSEQKGDTQEAKESAKPEVKRNSGVPKLLQIKNAAVRRAEQAEKRASELEEKLSAYENGKPAEEGFVDIDSRVREIMQAEREKQEVQQFFESNTEAKAKKKAIESLMDDHGFTVTDAWTFYQAKNDPKSLTKNSTKAYSSPSVPNFGSRKDRDAASASVEDLENQLKNLHKKGELSF